jgi:protein gp37
MSNKWKEHRAPNPPCALCVRYIPHPHLDQIDRKLRPNSRKAKRIFIDGHFDWNGDGVKREWLEPIVERMELCSIYTFPVLSKRPELYNRYGFSYPSNVILGATVTNEKGTDDWKRISALRQYENRIFLSFEPLLGELPQDVSLKGMDWAVVGALSFRHAKEKEALGHETLQGVKWGRGHRGRDIFLEPPKEWVNDIVKRARGAGAKVFLKPSLGKAWKGKLIREYP